jgi:hypothetical protein
MEQAHVYDPAQDEWIIAKTIFIYQSMGPHVFPDTPLDWPDFANFAMAVSFRDRGIPSFESIAGKILEVGAIACRIFESHSPPKRSD